MPQLSMHSPIGDLTISEDEGEIVSIDWGWARDQKATPLLKNAKRQLEDYFDGALETFDLPLRVEGTDFQKQVWREMCKIPAGKTLTYGDIAKRLKVSAQAVGTACGRNRFPVIIPCHRVVGANGLGGYSGAGGVETKIALLELEKAMMPL
ncbi:MAG: methylated-DNA--[protein]-cysteine S-methyltransferase [Rhodospirillaceae bacterium]